MFRTALIFCAVVACGTLGATMDHFVRSQHRVSLFAFDDEPTAAPAPEPNPFALSFWLTPFVRLTENPDSAGIGFGTEIAYFVSRKFAVTTSASLYSLLVDVRDERGWLDEKDTTGFEFTVGGRFRFFNYPTGALYFETRALYTVYGGPEPIRTTQSVGGGIYFGFEFGRHIVRGYIESGPGYLAAINYNDVGWLYNGDRNGAGGVHFELVRIGMRIYV